MAENLQYSKSSADEVMQVIYIIREYIMGGGECTKYEPLESKFKFSYKSVCIYFELLFI